LVLRAFSLVTAGVAACATAVLVGAPAMADQQITVRGAGFPDDRLAQLTMVGCSSIYDRTDETLAPFIGRGPDRAPLGTRSVGYDLTGGNAVGSLYYVDSMLDTTTAELAVHAEDGAAGVAYAGYQAPADADSSDVWIGRAAVAAPAGTWARVLATGLSYTWTKYDMVTHEVLESEDTAPATTVSDFAAAHGGDGPGFFTIGFGCDGAKFSMDAWRIGSQGDITSYDLEGLTTTTAIVGSKKRVEAGDEVTLTGRLRLGMGVRLRHGTLMLEAKPVGGRQFELVEVVDAAAADPSVVVRPTKSTLYRWRFADRPLAEGSVSSLFLVTVVAGQDPPDLPEPPGPTDGPSDGPSDEPTDEPTEEPTESPSDEPTEPSEPPSTEPTDGPESTPPAETETSEPQLPDSSVTP
jgi:hypothetical protein